MEESKLKLPVFGALGALKEEPDELFTDEPDEPDEPDEYGIAFPDCFAAYSLADKPPRDFDAIA